MKILYFTNAPFADLEISYIRELQRIADVKVLMYMLPSTTKSCALSVNKQINECRIIPCSEYMGFEQYNTLIDLKSWFIVNNCMGLSIKAHIRLAKEIKDFLYAFNPDVFHIVGYGLLHSFLLPILPKDLKTMVTIHDVKLHDKVSFFRNIYNKCCRNLVIKRFKNILLLSNTDIDYFEKSLKRIPHNLFFSKLGPYDYLRHYPITGNKYGTYILFFGTIRPYKGVNILLEAFKKSKTKKRGIKLVVAGKDFCGITQSMTQDNDIIIINRFIENDELANLINNSLYVIMPYLSATQSGVTKSAFALNKPVVCTNVGNLPNEVINDKFGIVVEPNNIDRLMEAIDRLSSNDALLRYYSHNISEQFNNHQDSWEYIVKEVYDNIYTKI